MSRFLFAVVLAVLPVGAFAGEELRPPKKPTLVGGKVKAVDAKANTVTITRDVDGKASDVIVQLSPDVTVAVDGMKAKLEDVPVGAPHARVMGGKLDASRVTDAEWLWVAGTSEPGIFKKVGGDTLTYKPDGPAANKTPDKTLKLSPDAKAMIGGKAGKFADFKPGDKIFIRYTADGKAALIVSRGMEPK